MVKSSATQALDLSAALLRAKTPADALRVTASLCRKRLRAPVIAWLRPSPNRPSGSIVIRGLERSRSQACRRALSRTAAFRFADADDVALGVKDPAGMDAPIGIGTRDVVLITEGNGDDRVAEFLTSAGSVLSDALEHIDAISWAQARQEQLDFGIAWAAHELREPLVAAKTALDHVLRSDAPSSPDEDLLRWTRDEVGRLNDLVEPLLRSAAFGGHLSKERADLVAVVREAAASCAPFADGRQIVLTAPPSVEIEADAMQLVSAVRNLISNALRFAPDRSVVDVRVARVDGRAVVSVRDRGSGIPLEEAERIFDPFVRCRSGTGTRASTGAGLGLFIARRIVERHDGTLQLIPTLSGALFSIELPVDRPGRRASAS